MQKAPDTILKAAASYLEHGTSLIPVSKNKVPYSDWKKYQSLRMTKEEFSIELKKFANSKIAAVCGRISQNLEIIDFDLKGEKYHDWVSLVERESPGLIARLWIEQTPSGGYHVAYRTDPNIVEGNKILAKTRIEVKGKGQHEYMGKKYTAIEYKGRFFIYPTAIETRGEGGYCVVSPSDGYSLIQLGDGGAFYQFPQITPQERGCLIRCAKALGDVKLNDIIDAHKSGTNRRGMPGGDFNDRFEGTLSLLLEVGWEIYKQNGSMHHLRRPGKDKGCSATLFDGKVLHVFSSNAEPFEEDRSYSPFAVYTLLKHGGGFSAAACELKRQGFGEKEESIGFDVADPVDIFGDTSLFGFPDWPENVCPSVIDDFAQDTARRIGVKVEMVAMPCIGAAAIAIPDNFVMRPKLLDTTWTESARIWIGIIADAGQKKTPALQAAFDPLKRLEIQYFNQYKEAMKQYQKDFEFYEKRKKAGGDMAEPVEPEHRRLIADDVTVEALRKVLEVNPSGVGIIQDELSGWITAFDAYRNSRGKDRADFCELYQGGHKLFDRAEKGHTYVPNWGASIIGGISTGTGCKVIW